MKNKLNNASNKSPRFTKPMRILILRSVLDAILKSSRKKPAIRYVAMYRIDTVYIAGNFRTIGTIIFLKVAFII